MATFSLTLGLCFAGCSPKPQESKPLSSEQAGRSDSTATQPKAGVAIPHNDHDESEETNPLHSEDQAHDHAHQAPHRGTLVELGEHFAHVELVLGEGGKLTAYVLDGEAENPIRLAQKEIVLQVEGRGPDVKDPSPGMVALRAVASPLTGESAGDTSEFAGQSDLLKGIDHFSGTIHLISVKGQEIKEVEFAFPDGNE
jgi:hypothetical protein